MDVSLKLATQMFLNNGLIFIVTAFVMVAGYDIPSVTEMSYCPAYCDNNFRLQPRQHCGSEYHCCGTTYNLYCCNDTSKAIPGDTEDVEFCFTWISLDWGYALGLVGAVVLITIIAACACRCRNKRLENTHSQSRNITLELEAVSSGSSEQPSTPQIFNPDHPFAFIPPEYQKDPPKYDDIDGVTLGVDNLAYSCDPYSSDPMSRDSAEPEAELGPPLSTPADSLSIRSLPPPYQPPETAALDIDSLHSTDSPANERHSAEPHRVGHLDVVIETPRVRSTTVHGQDSIVAQNTFEITIEQERARAHTGT